MEFSEKKNRYLVNSVSRGLAVLQVLADQGRPLTLSEIAGLIFLSSATAKRFCHTLCYLGFIYRDPQKRYKLTPKVFTLGYAVIRSQDWFEVAQYYLETLFKEIHETVNLAILEGNEIMYVKRIKIENILPFDLQIGSKLPVYCTSMGKCLMAFGPPEKVQSILKTLKFKPFTHRTTTCLEDYLEELDKVRKKGYAVNDEELSIGLRSIAAPIRDKDGWAKAALSIILPTKRFSLYDAEEVFAPHAIRTADEISHALIGMD